MKSTRAAQCLIVISALWSSGCISLLGPEDVRFRMSLASGVGIDRQLTLGVDGLTLRTAVALANVDVPVEDIHWVDFGMYKLRGPAHGLVSDARLPGYEPMVRVREDGEEVQILVKQNDSSTRGLIAMVQEGDELVLVRVLGRIDKLVGKLLERGDSPFDWQEFLESGPDATSPPQPPQETIVAAGE